MLPVSSGIVPTWNNRPEREPKLAHPWLPINCWTMNREQGIFWAAAIKASSSSFDVTVKTPCPALEYGFLITPMPPIWASQSGTSDIGTSHIVSGVKIFNFASERSAFNIAYAFAASALLRPPARHASVLLKTKVRVIGGIRSQGR